MREIGLGTTDGYAFTYDLGDILSLIKFADEQDSEITVVPFQLNSTASYRLRLIGVGNNFTGIVYNLTAPTVPLITLTGSDNDNSYTTGSLSMTIP